MAVRFSIRNGQRVPSPLDLNDFELGFDYTDASKPRLHTRVNGNIVECAAGDATSLGGILPENWARTDIDETFEQNVTVVGTLEATAERAKYADIAEYYEAGEELEPGIILMVGNEFETEIADGTKPLMGVCSTNPAYLMNTKIQEEVEHYAPIALKGRIPVNITGSAERGDFIVVDKENPGKGKAIKKIPAKFNKENEYVGICITPGEGSCEVKV